MHDDQILHQPLERRPPITFGCALRFQAAGGDNVSLTDWSLSSPSDDVLASSWMCFGILSRKVKAMLTCRIFCLPYKGSLGHLRLGLDERDRRDEGGNEGGFSTAEAIEE